jgi:hypothetical protein
VSGLGLLRDFTDVVLELVASGVTGRVLLFLGNESFN